MVAPTDARAATPAVTAAVVTTSADGTGTDISVPGTVISATSSICAGTSIGNCGIWIGGVALGAAVPLALLLPLASQLRSAQLLLSNLTC